MSFLVVVHELQRFFLSVARVVVNNDDKEGTALNPIFWSAASLPKKRDVDRAVWDFAWLPGPGSLWTGGWQGWPDVGVTQQDVAVWPYSVASLFKPVSFLKSLHCWLRQTASRF